MAGWAIAAALAGGVASSAIGASKQSAADSAAAATRQTALDRFTGKQANEFDTRQQGLKDSAGRIGAIQDESFGNQTGLQRANLAETLANKTKYDNAGTLAKLGGISKIGDINTGRNVLRDASFLEQGGLSDAERARQAQFQNQGTDIASKVVARMGVPAFNADVGDASFARKQLLDSTISAPATTTPGVDGFAGADLAKRVNERVGMARGRAAGMADVSGYGDAGSAADRLLGRAGERVDILSRKATDSRAALDPEIKAAQQVRTNADKDSETRKANAQADVDSYMTILNQQKDMEGARVDERQKAMSDLMDKFYSGEIKTEQDFITALTNSSLNYEDALQALTNFQISGTYGKSTLGQILSGAGSSLLGAGTSALVGHLSK